MDPQSSDSNQVHLKDFEPIPQDILSIFPEGLIRRNLILPVEKKGGRVKAVVPKTQGVIKPEGLQLVAGCPVDLCVAPLEEIIGFIDQHFPKTGENTQATIINLDDNEPKQETQNEASQSADTNKIEELIEEAIKNRASEILIEQKKQIFRFRMKIRGVWVQDGPWRNWDKDSVRDLVSTVREMGDMHKENGVRWVEAHRPFEFNKESYSIVFKLSETVDVGLLSIFVRHQSENFYDPVKWGMESKQVKEFEKIIFSRKGLVLFAGIIRDDVPEMLHGCIREVSRKGLHVISVENDMGEWLPDVDQFNAKGNEAAFDDMLKMAVRHDPDLLVVDPIKKKEHFEYSLRAGMDGTLVFGSQGAWDAADALAQMLNIGVDPYLVNFGLAGIIVQRVIRLNCPRCQKRDNVRRDQVKDIGIPVGLQPASFFRGMGCESCHNTGFDKETHIYEVIPMNEELQSQLVPKMSPEKIRTIFNKGKNFYTLRQGAIKKAISGQTALSEVIRVSSK